MATIKAIEARSVHQIQSGQVIVDLCSVAKELVENSLDAGATSIEVRFRNNGLDLIEVQDNGGGISPENYENVALKHYTSKLSTYDDLTSLQTFGFRGEALSSLCALSDFHVTTAQANQAPRATRLEFEQSGKLKKTQMIAGPKGTTASVEGIFKKLPVRRRELEKNIKREYGKVLNLLHAYACVSTGVRFSVKNTMGKARNVVVFATNGNQTTKDNIANVYGAKTLLALIPLDLELEFEPSGLGRWGSGGDVNNIQVRGHVSRPVFGEGRQTPDRQMFFVNSRPCALPQIAKAFNEVYKSFNVAQSPFVFADFHMDTNAYDVNVSPDKRTILLHDAGALIDSLKQSLTQLFEASDQTVPQSQVLGSRPLFKQQRLGSQVETVPKSTAIDATEIVGEDEEEEEEEEVQPSSQDRMKSLLSGITTRSSRTDATSSPIRRQPASSQEPVESPLPSRARSKEKLPSEVNQPPTTKDEVIGEGSTLDQGATHQHPKHGEVEQDGVEDSPQTSAPADAELAPAQEPGSPLETPNAIQKAFDRMRPRRVPEEVATITIGNKTVTSMVGSGVSRKREVGDIDLYTASAARKRRIPTSSRPNIFGKQMRDFAAPGSVLDLEADEDDEIEDDEVEEDEEGQDEGEDTESDGESRSYAPSDHDTASRGSVDNEAESEIRDPNMQRSPSPTDEEMDDEAKKRREEAEVERLIREAEEKASLPQANSLNRVNKLSKGAGHRDSTVQLTTIVDGSLFQIQFQAQQLQDGANRQPADATLPEDDVDVPQLSQAGPEERLSLTVTKDDFSRMRIIGQFNLGFILATRSSKNDYYSSKDELFIIDQHASDEKINFERLQAETIVQNQRLVQPKRLDLTAVEEEIVIENQDALEKNGFIVDIDDSGDEPIGRRCRLLSLPLSKEVVFNVRDLEELIVLLSETASSSVKPDTEIPRPSKVRKMFAMRACRSSIMIGKNLTHKQMEKVVRNMGTIDKPWNCPHGRPTMRHLLSLGQWDEWDEYSHLDDGVDRLDIWKEYLDEINSDTNAEDVSD